MDAVNANCSCGTAVDKQGNTGAPNGLSETVSKESKFHELPFVYQPALYVRQRHLPAIASP
jgi:hypothetical protein